MKFEIRDLLFSHAKNLATALISITLQQFNITKLPKAALGFRSWNELCPSFLTTDTAVFRAWYIWCPFGGSWKMNPLPGNSRVSEDALRGKRLSFHHHVDFFSERLLDSGSFPSLNSWWSGAELQLSVQIFSNWGWSKAGYVTNDFLDRQAARRWSDREADYFVINHWRLVLGFHLEAPPSPNSLSCLAGPRPRDPPGGFHFEAPPSPAAAMSSDRIYESYP